VTSGRFPFTAFPSGWFRVASASDVKPGDVRPIRILGRDLVLCRFADGPARVFDAHCPHLGTHLGFGGRIVDGATLQCPFHGWRYDASGTCVHVPGTDAIPKATLGAWHAREWGGQVMLWSDPRRGAPGWELPELPERAADGWKPFRHANRWTIRTQTQEVGENGMDIAHFPFLHRQQTAEIRSEEARADGPVFVHRTFQRYTIFGLAKLWAKDVVGPLEVTLIGPGIAINRASVKAGFELSYCYAFFFTPLDEEHVEVWSMLALKRLGNPLLERVLWAKARTEGARTIEQDIPIWENKRYQERPILSVVDGPILQFRRWAKQFYEGADG